MECIDKEKLVSTFANGFTHSEMEQFLSYRLGIQWEQQVGPDNYSQQVFELIEDAYRHKTLEVMILAAHKYTDDKKYNIHELAIFARVVRQVRAHRAAIFINYYGTHCGNSNIAVLWPDYMGGRAIRSVTEYLTEFFPGQEFTTLFQKSVKALYTEFYDCRVDANEEFCLAVQQFLTEVGYRGLPAYDPNVCFCLLAGGTCLKPFRGQSAGTPITGTPLVEQNWNSLQEDYQKLTQWLDIQRASNTVSSKLADFHSRLYAGSDWRTLNGYWFGGAVRLGFPSATQSCSGCIGQVKDLLSKLPSSDKRRVMRRLELFLKKAEDMEETISSLDPAQLPGCVTQLQTACLQLQQEWHTYCQIVSDEPLQISMRKMEAHLTAIRSMID